MLFDVDKYNQGVTIENKIRIDNASVGEDMRASYK
jgi:hypothetical protein